MRKRTICDEIREVYKLYIKNVDYSKRNEIDERIEFIFLAAKKMDKRLRFYKMNRMNDLQFKLPEPIKSIVIKAWKDAINKAKKDAIKEHKEDMYNSMFPKRKQEEPCEVSSSDMEKLERLSAKPSKRMNG